MADTPVPPPSTSTDSVREAFKAAMEANNVSDEQFSEMASRNPILDMIPGNQPVAEEEEEEVVEEPTPSITQEESDPPPDEGEEAPPAGTESSVDDDSIPVKYFEVHLTVDGTAEGDPLPADVRKSIIDSLKGRDREIQAAKREAAEARNAKPDPEPEPEPEPAQVDDDQLMEAFGYDKDDPMYDVKKEVAAPLLRQTAQLSNAVQQLLLEQQAEKFEAYWNSTLDDLEGQYGELSPLDIESDAPPREQLLDWAIENEVFDPTDAYNRVMVPAKSLISKEAEKRRASAAEALKTKKKPAGTTRPKGGGGGEQKPTEPMSPKEAAEAAAKQLGADWATALSQPL